MNPRIPVTIFIRLLGLLLAALALPAFVRFLHDLLELALIGGISVLLPTVSASGDPIRDLGSVLQFFLGLYLLVNGRWVIARVLRGLHGKCPKCNYDLTGLRGPRCPECGTRFTS